MTEEQIKAQNGGFKAAANNKQPSANPYKGDLAYWWKDGYASYLIGKVQLNGD